MAEVLVLAELDPTGDGVRKTTLEALTAARALGEPAAVVTGAPGTAAKVKDALAEYGAATVYVAESPELDEYLVAPKAEVLAQVVQAQIEQSRAAGLAQQALAAERVDQPREDGEHVDAHDRQAYGASCGGDLPHRRP